MGLLKNLFGKKKEEAKAPTPKEVEVQASIQVLSKLTEKIEKRQKVLELEIKNRYKSAIVKNQAGNTKGALFDMK